MVFRSSLFLLLSLQVIHWVHSFFSQPILACITAEQSGIMDKIKWVLNKLSVAHEPGLTNAQLMLTNDDLRPGKTALLSMSFMFLFLSLVV